METKPPATLLPSPVAPCLVSACLVGLCTRYDGRLKTSRPCLDFLNKHFRAAGALQKAAQEQPVMPGTHPSGCCWIPVCPEQLGGLSTPREAAEIIDGNGDDVLDGKARVMTRSTAMDVTENFIRGAEQLLLLVRQLDIRYACLKAKSPSCAVSGNIGVAAALLKRNGITLIEF